MQLRVRELIDAVNAGRYSGKEKVLGVQVFDRFDDMMIYSGPAEWVERTQDGVFIVAHDLGNKTKCDKKRPPAVPWKELEGPTKPIDRDDCFVREDNPFDIKPMNPPVFEAYIKSLNNQYVVAQLEKNLFKVIPASESELFSFFTARMTEDVVNIDTDNNELASATQQSLNVSNKVSSVDGKTLVLEDKVFRDSKLDEV